MESFPLFVAASISKKFSDEPPSRMERQDVQESHAAPSLGEEHRRDRARIRPRVVLPEPHGPANRYDWWNPEPDFTYWRRI
jgi:hypothetical protein